MSAEQVSAEQCDCCESRQNCLWDVVERLTRERDQYKQIAELNLETVKTIQDRHAQELVRLANSVRKSQ
jgi:hypothetical protein